MGRKAGLSREDVVGEAARLADEEGWDGVTLTSVAARLGVRPPSLYAHLDGLPGLRRSLTLLAAERLAGALVTAAAGERGRDALRRLCTGYRAFAAEHPGLYAAAQRAVPPGQDEEVYGALLRAVDPMLKALREAGVAEPDLLHVARGFRSALHGFVSLEARAGFGLPASVDESFERLVDMLVAGATGHT